jgi:hypothetical protein
MNGDGRTQRYSARTCRLALFRLTPGFLSQLQEHVAAREVERGIACLRSHQDLIANLDPCRKTPPAC